MSNVSPVIVGSLGTSQSGPQATVLMFINDIMKVYEQLMDLSAEQNLYQINFQKSSALAEFTAGENSAQSQSMGTWMQAAGEFAQGAETAVGIGVTSYATKGAMTEAGTYSSTYENLESYQAPIQERLAQLESGAQVGPVQNDQSGDILSAKTDLLAGKFNESTGAISDEAKIAIQHIGEPELREIQDALQSKLQAAAENKNSAWTQVQTKQQQIQQFQSVLNNATNGTFSGIQALYQKDQGQSQAAAGLAGSNNQIDQSMQSNSQQYIGKYYDQMLQELQVYQQVAQTNSQALQA